MITKIRNAAFGLCLFVFLTHLSGGASVPEGEGKLRVLVLEGTPYQMGMIHGKALKPEITKLMKRWKADLARTYKVPAEDFIEKFLKYTDFRPSIDRWTPGLLDEVRGIADGAGVDFETMYAFQLIDESWVMNADLGLDKCTAIAAGKRGGAPAFTSQTQDIPRFYHGSPTVLRIRDKGESLETLVFTIPGVIALNGLNSRSVGVCVNAVTQLAHSPKGLPVAFVIRGILRQKTYEQAVKFLRDIQPAAPQNYVLGGPLNAAGFERSAGKMIPFLPFEGAEFTYHTNHPLVNDDLDPKFLARLKRDGVSMEKFRTSCPRFNFLGRTLTDNSAAIDLAVLKTIYANRVSGINNGGTYGCTIMVLGEKPELHISPGRPDVEPFQVLDFSPRNTGPSSAGQKLN
ncbi:MAG: C45 family peptidase [Candidatus Aminicenantes bacterium]|nr:C45 family peptidase [Candidatus Aminicenantes bacterium]